MINNLRTALLLALMTVFVLLIGSYLGGRQGIVIAFVIAMLMNFTSYWFSDKIVLSIYRAREASKHDAPDLYHIVEGLSEKADLPVPKIYIIPQDARVMVNDPAAFYYYSQRQCLALPNNDVDTMLQVAARYDAQYLLVDKNAPSPLQALYDQPGADPRLRVVQRFVDADGDPMIVYRIGES